MMIKELLGSVSYSDSNFEIEGGAGIHKIILNGVDISNQVKSVDIRLRSRELPLVTLDVVGR